MRTTKAICTGLCCNSKVHQLDTGTNYIGLC